MLRVLRRLTDVGSPKVVGPITVSHGINEFFAIVIPPIIPLLVTELEITYGQAGFLLTVFFLMYVLFQLPAGLVADRVGKTRLMVVGLVMMAVGIFLAGLAPDYEALLVAQIIAGLGGSTFHPAGLSLISDVESSATEGKAMGVFGFGGTLGTLAAPLFVGGVAAVFGWRAALIGAAGLGGGMTLVLLLILLRARGTPGRGVSANGGVALPDHRAIVQQLIRLITTREIAILCAITIAMSLQHRAIQTFTTAYVAAETGAGVSVSNLAFFTLLVGGSIASLWAGDLADRVNRKFLCIGASLATAILLIAIIAVPQLTPRLPHVVMITVLAGWFGLIGFMMYASYPVKNALISEEAEQAYSGSLFGIIQSGSSLGSASGPVVFGVLATEWGVVAAFPAIASVSLILALLFVLLHVLD